MSADLQQPPPQQLHPQQQASSPSQAQCGQKKRPHRLATCFGCRTEILDQYILQVAPDMEWHASCLKCAECQQFLDENCTCFVKEKRTYCKNDYMRLFAAKCCKCAESFNKNDFVMRARNKIYHPDCFCCESCSRQLVSGDEFALRDEHLFCKLCIRDSPPGSGPFLPQEQPPPPPPPQLTTLQPDTDVLDSKNNSHHSHFNHPFVQELTSPSPSVPTDGDINGNSISPLSSSNSSSTNGGNNHHHHHQNGPTSGNTKLQLTGTSDAPPMQTSSRHRESVRHVHKQNSEHKPTRVRTVLNERQLQTLRSCYQANPRPDALMKEQLVEVTGLSPRVIRVWFQNKRCKDKKRSIQMKMLQQQEKDGRQLHNIANMRGVPLVATSPVRHESPVQHPLEVQSYHPPWKAFADYALQHEADPNAPHFQHLVNQMHGYDVSLPPGPPGPGSDSHLVQLQNGPCTPLSYLADHELHNSNMSQIPGTPSEMSSPCTSD